MGKYDLYNKKTHNDELPENPIFSWKIYVCQGHLPRVQLIDKVEASFSQHGFNLEVQEPDRLVYQHPQYGDYPVKVSFKGDVTTTSGGRHYRLCVHSESLTLTIEDATNQKELYDLVLSILPPTWGKESYCLEEGKAIPMKKHRFRLRQKRKR
jgi:hypothetical protein